MPKSCEVVEVRNVADADGFPCSRTASTQCFDCGSELCESHTETCGICHGIFYLANKRRQVVITPGYDS